MSVTQARELIVRHHKYAWVLMGIALLVVSGVYFKKEFIQAATYTFTQASWAGGTSATTAVHATDQTGWTKYSSASNVTVSTTVILPSTNGSFTDDVTTSSSGNSATGGGFSSGERSNTVVTEGGVRLSSAKTNLYATNVSAANTIKKINSTGSVVTSINAGSGSAHLAFDSSGNLYTGNNSGTSIAKIAPPNNQITNPFASVGSGPRGIVVDGSGNIYVANQTSNTVSKIDASSGSVLQTFSVGAAPVDLAIDSSGNVYSANSSGNSISKIKPDNTVTVSFASLGASTGPSAIAIDGSGNLYTANITADSVKKIAPDGTVTATYSLGAGANPVTLAVDSSGNVYTNNDISPGTIVKVTPGDVVSTLASGIYLSRLAIDDNDNLYASYYNLSTIKKITTTGGSPGTITTFATPGLYYRELAFDRVYASSGTFTSNVIDFGRPSVFTTFAWSETLNGQSIAMEVRSSLDNLSWPAWGGCTIANNTADMTTNTCVTNGHRYLQYKATFTSDTAATPILNSVSINNTQYSASTGDLISSAYDSGDATNLISRLSWTGSATSSTETIKLQLRSSADGTTWSNWCGPSTACAGSDYFLYTDSGVALATSHPLRSGGNDRYLQYRAFLNSGGAVTPALNSVAVQYVVNAPPSFDATYGTNGVTVSQGTDGKVSISYKVRDVDTTTGSTNPGYVTPSFEYSLNGGSSWSAISSGDLVAGDTTNKAVDGTNYTTYTATWTATSTTPGVYRSLAGGQAKVRVTANDNEAANNTATATSAAFALDTTNPVVTAFTIAASSTPATVNLTLTDDSTLEYRLCDDVALTTGCTVWTTITSGAATAVSRTLATNAGGNLVAYLQVRDAVGNTSTGTGIVPLAPANFDFKDVSNVSINAYWEFVSWSVYTDVSNAAFGSYKVYHSTDGTNYSLLTSIADANVNYYRHNITTATSSTQYYKVVTVDSGGDISPYTAVLSDVPNGQGSLDTTAPTVTSPAVPSANLKNTSAQVTFTTDEIAVGTVEYSTQAANNYALSATSGSYTTSHSIYLTGLTSNTTYVYRVKATDVAGNTSAAVSGGTFTTVGGPVISNIVASSITDVSASIVWNTSTSSDSYVYYSTSASLASPSTAGSATMVAESPTAGVFPHQVNLSSLTAGTRYYYYVKSTDSASNSTTDTNSGQYHSFVTTLDTNPPTISATSTPILSSEAAVIVWQTDELATSQVYYDRTARAGNSAQYLYRNAVEPTMSIFHVATLSSATEKYDNIGNSLITGGNALTAETTYYTAVRSVDAAGNAATSAEWSFTTPSSGTVTIIQSGGASKKGETPDTSPPSISNVKITNITPFSATVSFDTDEETDGFVEYGKDTSYSDTAGDKIWATSHTIKLRGLTLGTEYFIKVTAHDKAGNTGTGGEQSFKTTFLSENLKDLTKVENIEAFQKEIEDTIESILPSLVPPFVSKPIVSDITESGATIAFKTNIKAFPIIGYVEDGAYSEDKENPYTGEVSDTENKATEHTIKLAGLKPNTKYHYQARAFSLPQVIGKSVDYTFITKAAKIAGSVVERKKDSFTVVWTTTEPTTSIVEYKNLKSGVTERKVDDARRTSHSMKIENLPSGTTYEVNISGLTEQGNTVEAGSPLSVTTSTDTVAPTISGFKVDNALVPGRTDRIQTIVSWDTDEPANGTVFFEEGAGTAGDTKELANKSEALDSYVVKHSVILPNLKPGTIYRLKVTSADDSGNEGSFGPRTVITPRQTESITDIIFKNFEDSFKFLRQI